MSRPHAELSRRARAPDDGSEEAAFYLYDERKLIAQAGVESEVTPVASLRLAASLGFDKARRVWRARERVKALGPDPYATRGAKKERFIRDDKARSWTEREGRTEKWLDGG